MGFPSGREHDGTLILMPRHRRVHRPIKKLTLPPSFTCFKAFTRWQGRGLLLVLWGMGSYNLAIWVALNEHQAQKGRRV